VELILQRGSLKSLFNMSTLFGRRWRQSLSGLGCSKRWL